MVLRLLVIVAVALAVSAPRAGVAVDRGDIAMTDLGQDEGERDASEAPLLVAIVMPVRPPERRHLPPRASRAPRTPFVTDVFRPPRPSFERV